ncbi:hypothetical protein NDU88_003315 [Pleurodeles waltl]|uniref:Uncharacterized protein n=1 Tax=Pleurodeles waltl TaxID=8319 RepID=A0AAV7LEZ9_PLEWA|nr:hypothetical protein NDU88_003315 [Pleurodeles waltl]
MAPKTAHGSRPKPGPLDLRHTQPLPRGVVPRSGSHGNAGKRTALKAQGALEEKQPAPVSVLVPERNYSEIYNSSTAPSTSTSTLRRTTIKRHEGRTDVASPDKLTESNEKRKKKKAARRVRAMSWDYTGTRQLQHSLDDVSVGPVCSGTDAVSEGAPPPSLHLIYQTIMAQHKQIQGDSKKARVTMKQLQVAISKIAMTYSEIGEWTATIESRANVLETELG